MNSSTSSSKRWLWIFFAILVPVSIGYAAGSEWLIRTEVLPHDNFEWISARLRNSTQQNAAFGDSHVAAVPDYNTDDFVNLGVGATTIRKMDQRVRYYFGKIKPGEVIIQADPHLFAEYRLQAPSNYVPESYSESRLRIFDPQHRGFLPSYWSAFLAKGQLVKKETNAYDQLWDTANKLETTSLPETQSDPLTAEAQTGALSETKTNGARALPHPPAGHGATSSEQPAEPDSETLAKFNAFMDYEVSAHTPVADFRTRGEAGIYRNLIKYLVSRGARVCLMNYPVDRYYRVRADAISTFNEVREFYKEVARENNIPYVNFWDRFDDPSMFQNTDHVNQNGSPILAKEARQACFGHSKS
ncbi:hypothetical protein [Bradyrhizobium arachidis]|uniref:SGNH/GDSL hydrolase family protein n=1 Tax=Bradyrhizobium arachidis TaxID=858423 RepID=UPI0021625A2E|nr:hypothetical protein [Bradyrhizobium arachidis]UVO31808.1 hypothetical protein KUF59_14880 [Bradyrhizobium arachidis]